MKKFFTASDPVVPVHHPRLLVETAVALGADRLALLENVGLTGAQLEQPETRLTYDQLSTLERNALRLTKDPALGLRWGRATRFLNHGIVGIAAVTSENLEAAFQIAKQYYLQLTPGWEMDLRVEGGRGYFTLKETIPRGDLRVFATEALLAGFYGLVTQALGRDFAVTMTRVNYPRPDHYRLYTELICEAPILFDQPLTEVEFDPSILTVPITTADPITRSVALQYCATQAESGTKFDGVAAQVRRVLLAHGGRRMTLVEVARVLQTSARSLRRALSEMGSSFQAVSEEVLKQAAVERMRSRNAKVERIAQELGFTDARSFRRAFKRWTGQNPNDFRRTLEST